MSTIYDYYRSYIGHSDSFSDSLWKEYHGWWKNPEYHGEYEDLDRFSVLNSPDYDFFKNLIEPGCPYLITIEAYGTAQAPGFKFSIHYDPGLSMNGSYELELYVMKLGEKHYAILKNGNVEGQVNTREEAGAYVLKWILENVA